MSQVILRELKLNSAVKYVAREGFVNNFPITFAYDNPTQLQVFVGFKRVPSWELKMGNGLPSVVLPEDLKIGQSITIRRATPADGVPHTYQYKGNAQGGAEFNAKTIDENFEYMSELVAEVEDYNTIAQDNLNDIEEKFDDTVAYMDEELAKGKAIAEEALDTANRADKKADSAVETADTSKGIAEDAKEASDGAVSTSNEALRIAEEAKDTSINANEISGNALIAASRAETNSEQAVELSETAVSTSNEALGIAQDAKATAEGIDAKAQLALDASNSAVSIAKGAESIASDAKDIADNAEQVALGVDGKAQEALDHSEQALRDINNKRDIDDNVFDEYVSVKSGGTVRGRMSYDGDGLQIEQVLEDGTQQNFTLPKNGEGGEIVLKQELANPDMGASMVARGVVAVASIADLLSLPDGQRREGLRYLVKGYHSGSNIGGGEFYWSNNITELDDRGIVFRVGSGGFRRIISGEISASFWGDNTKILYVNPAGSDENNGTIDYPLKTLQGAFDRLASWGSFFVGQFEIRLSAGEHTAGAFIEGLDFSQRLRITGEPVNSSETPLTIFNMAGVNNHGIRFRRIFCYIKDIKIQDNDNASYAGIQCLQSDVHTINCHSENMAWYGMTFDENSKAYVQGGKHSNGARGVRFYNGTTYNIGYNVKTTFLNLESTGVQVQGYCYGIFNEVSIGGCRTGINLIHSRARIGRSDFFNNETDLNIGSCSSWVESNGNTGLNNVLYKNGASELTLDNSSRNFTTMGYVTGTTVSGTTERTVLAELWRNVPGLIKGDRGIRIQAKGFCAGNGTKAIEVRIGLGSIYLPELSSGNQWFILTCDIINIEGVLNYFATFETKEGKSVVHDIRGVDLGVATGVFTIYGVPESPDGSITLHSAQLDIIR